MAPPQWAYQVENFVTEPDEELLCSVCRSVFCDPVMCPCDHVFCRVCITKWLQNSRNCPICRKRVSSSSIKQMVPIVKNIIMKLMLNCHNKSLGCSSQFSLESSEAHVKQCEYEFVQCKNKPCKDRLFRKDITEHEARDCPHRSVKCKTCKMKMYTPALPEKHNCIQALQLRLRKKNNIIRKNNNTIEELKNEIEALKAASQGSEQLVSSTSRDFAHPLASSLSPEEILINIAEMASTSSSLTSDTDDDDDDDSSGNSIIIFTNSPFDNSESDSFSTFMDNEDNSIEYSRNESPRDIGEYRHAESQTTNELPLSNLHFSRNGNSAFETGGLFAEAPVSAFGETEERSQPGRQVKRRPTTQIPAKRRLPPLSPGSSDVGESAQQSPKRCWRMSSAETESGSVASDRADNHNSYMEAGPSSVAMSATSMSASAMPASALHASVPDMSSNTKWQFRSKYRLLNQKIAEQKSSASETAVLSSRTTAPSRNAVFERTLALLEQYNLESDPEWLPEYASHRGDTTSESDSSFDAEFVDESSSSELSDSDSNNEDNSNGNRDANVPDLVKWMYDNNTSDEDDPDWNPMKYLENKYA